MKNLKYFINELKSLSSDKKKKTIITIAENKKMKVVIKSAPVLTLINNRFVVINDPFRKSKSVNQFIKELERYDNDKMDIPVYITAPNKLDFAPSVKMIYGGLGSPLIGDQLESILITY